MAPSVISAVVSSTSTHRSRQSFSDNSINNTIKSSSDDDVSNTSRRYRRINVSTISGSYHDGSDIFYSKDIDKKSKINSISSRQWVVLIVLMFVTMTSSFAVCLFPPFFPRIAEEKGFSSAVYGAIIGTNCLTSFIVTPFIGRHLKTIGIRYALVMGMLAGGFCCTLSGFLEFFSPDYTFVIIAVCIRIVHACSNAFVILATFSYIASEFPDNVGKIFSMTRCVMNLGQLFGPTVGGAFKMIGGFYMPFVVMGTLQVIFSIVSIPIMPDFVEDPKYRNSSKKSMEITICQILKIKAIWISFITFIFATMCNGFLSINLEPCVIRQFHLTPPVVGVLFGLKDGANSFASPLWGFLCDRKKKVKPFIVISAILVAVSFLLIGAFRIVDTGYKLTLGIVIISLCLNGIGIGGEQVSGVVDAMHEVGNAGYPDNPNIHGIIAGLWSSLSGAGRFISRAGSGMMVHAIGFDYTAAFVMSLQGIIVIITVIYMIFWESCLLYPKSSISWDNVPYVEVEEDHPIFSVASMTPSNICIDIPDGIDPNIRIANSCPTRVQPEKSLRVQPIRRHKMSGDREDILERLSCSVLSNIN
ncbi:MFS-type transporter SLC18B1 isoform X2 [Lepeophtheirus salmonis]|uniref:MFS-type transporter SLC18B1 isoform X2 n=1 Tax=Lepeophtheirus salmonis TaxID=72036 RepID=UPI001AE9FB83|nr:MFS-type transporter SLC18B1-like isoform X2 [Lepeophtheirus salmonis]